MTKSSAYFGFALMNLAACTSTGPSTSTNALAASAEVQRAGVAAYRPSGDGAALLDETGAVIGQLRLSTPTASSRHIEIGLGERGSYEAEIDRPLASRFLVALQGRNVYELVQVDPALAPLFASFNLEISLMPPTKQISDPLTTSQYATCLHANTGAGCHDLSGYPQYYCVYSWDFPFNGNWAEKVDSCTNCNSACASQFGMKQYDCQAYPEVDCQCGIEYTTYVNDVSCPRVSCGTVGQRDMVERWQSCQDPGSCSQASTYVGCTTL